MSGSGIVEPAPLGIAVVGAGSISDFHLRGIVRVPGARVTMVVARHTATAARLAEEHGAEAATLEEALGSPSVQAAVIATPDSTHASLAERFLLAGKHVLVQKPLAESARAARRVMEVAAASRRVLSVSFMHRYLPEVRGLRELLAQGRLGRVLSVRVRNATGQPGWADWFYQSTGSPTDGVVGQLGVHGIDLVLSLFGDISSVSAVAKQQVRSVRLADGRRVENEVPDHACAIYELADGMLVSHEMSWAEVGGTDRFRMEVYGTEGTAWLRSPASGLDVLRDRSPSGRASVPLPGGDPGELLHRDFVRAVGGDRSLVTAGVARRGLEVVEAILASSEGGRRIGLRPPEPDDLAVAQTKEA